MPEKFVIELGRQGGIPFYRATWSGDPGRTFSLRAARSYPSRTRAAIGLAYARRYRAFEDARILPYEDADQSDRAGSDRPEDPTSNICADCGERPQAPRRMVCKRCARRRQVKRWIEQGKCGQCGRYCDGRRCDRCRAYDRERAARRRRAEGSP